MWKPEEENGEIIYYECDKCGYSLQIIAGTPEENNFNYCPQCGYRHIKNEVIKND